MGARLHTSGEKRVGRRRRVWWILLCLLLVAAGSASASVTMAEAQGANAPPVANNNAYQVKKDGTLTVPAAGVLKNDLDPDGDALSAARDSSPRHGRLTLRSSGSFVYEPDKGYRGKDSFVYRATDAAGGADTATVEIMVWAGERPPLARDDAYGIDEDGTLTVPARGVLMNDRESDDRRLFATKVTDPAHGSLSLVRDGSFVYTPDGDYSGEDSFIYRAKDGRGRSDEGAVRISVDAINDAPVYTDAAGNTSQTINEGANLAALEATDTDGDTLAFELTSGSLPPGITLENGGGFTGSAGGRAAGNYTANIRVSDGNGETATTALAVTVNGVEEAAVAEDVNVATDEDTDKTITLSATDADTDNLTFSVGSPNHGTLGTSSAPDCTTSAGTTTCTTTVVYTPEADYNGPDSFTYTAGDSEPATVNITVNPVNDEPVAEADTKTTPENTPLVFPASDLVANDSEGAANEDAQVLSVDSVSDPAGGTVVLNNDEITFTPTADYNGPASFKYTVCDSGSPQECSTQTATVNVTVSPVNSKPTASATPGSLDIDEDAAAQTVALAGADTETAAANLRFTITEAPAHGVLKKDTTALGTGDGFTGSPTDVTYKPDADYNGTDSFKFEVTDRGDPDNCGTPAPACAAQESDAMTVPITVNSVVDQATISSGGTLAYTENDPPTPIDGGLGVTHPEGTQISKAEVRITNNYQSGEDVLAFDDNDAGDNITLDPASAGATLMLRGADSAANYQAALRAVTYENTSENPSSLTRTVTLTATDANSVASSPATRDIAVTPVDDLPVAVNDSATVLEDAAATDVPVLDNDTDVDGGAKTISSPSDPANGTAAVTGGGTGLTYRPDANYCNDPPATNLDTFTYTLNGGSQGTVSMTVTCVNDAPVADDETFSGTSSAVGNTTLLGDDPSDGAPTVNGPKKTISGDILDGDTDVDNAPGELTVRAQTKATADGGSITFQADGDFTYHPPAGCDGGTTDMVQYTVEDNHPTDEKTGDGTLTIHVSQCVWYVDDSAVGGGDGRSHSPYNSLTPLNNSAADADASGERIFLYDGTYTGGLTLENNQPLYTEDHGLVVGDGGAGNLTLEPGDGAGSTLQGGLALGSGNTVQGLDFGTTGSGSVYAISGTSVGTANINDVTGGDLNNPAGGAINIAGTNNTLNFQFGTLSSSGSSGNAVSILNASGTVTGQSGTLSNATGTTLNLDGGSLNFTYSGAVSDDSGQLISIRNKASGTTDFNGAVDDVTTNPNNGGGISLQSNGTALTRFDGGLNLSTGSTNGIVATSGGTLALPDPAAGSNSIVSTTGTPVNVASTTIHADDLVFEKISSNGSTNGIVLNNTGTSGNLSVTGNGGVCTIATPTCSGGTIQNTTGDGVSLTNTNNPSFANVRVKDTGRHGISGTTTSGLALSNSLVQGAGDADNEAGLFFATVNATNLTGNSSITNTVIDQPAEVAAFIQNYGGTLNLTVSGSTFSNTARAAGQPGEDLLRMIADRTSAGSATITTKITGSTFSNSGSDDITAIAQSSTNEGGGTMNLTVDGNTFVEGNGVFENCDTIGCNSNAILVHGVQASTIRYTVQNNTIRNHLDAGVVARSDNTANVQGVIQNNTIGQAGVARSGSYRDRGILLISDDDSDHIVRVENNIIHSTHFHGIYASAADGTNLVPEIDLTILGNTTPTPSDTGYLPSIGVDITDRANACARTENNTAAPGKGSSGSIDFLLYRDDPASTATFKLEGLPSPTTDASAYVKGKNPASADPVYAFASQASGASAATFTGGTCRTPVATPTP